MSILTELPACGAPAASRIEIFVPKPGTTTIENVEGTWYACSEHVARVETAVRDAKLIPYVMGRRAEGRCGDGMDYTVTPSVRLTAPAPSAETRAAAGKKKRKKAKKTRAVIWWRRKPCPPWCGDYHDASDDPGDRVHLMKFDLVQQIELTQHEPKPNFDKWSPQLLAVEIEQHVDRVEPVVKLTRDDSAASSVTLTWEEVAQLRAALDQLEVIAGG